MHPLDFPGLQTSVSWHGAEDDCPGLFHAVSAFDHRTMVTAKPRTFNPQKTR